MGPGCPSTECNQRDVQAASKSGLPHGGPPATPSVFSVPLPNKFSLLILSLRSPHSSPSSWELRVGACWNPELKQNSLGHVLRKARCGLSCHKRGSRAEAPVDLLRPAEAPVLPPESTQTADSRARITGCFHIQKVHR